MSGPLVGVRVVELGAWVAGPGAGAILADWGADVIKIEPPGGEAMRIASQAVLQPGSDINPHFDPANRGKRSIELDLREEGQRQSCLALIDTADVFITNVRAAGLVRLGLDSDTLLARNPRLVYGIITGYGLTGPDADAGAYDMGAYWARSGIAHLMTQSGSAPPIQPNAMGDRLAASTLAGLIGTALFHRERTGEGQLVSTSLLRVAAYQVGVEYNVKLMSGIEPTYPERTSVPNPLWNNYATKDGRRFWLICPETDRHWPVLARLVERPEWIEDPRYASDTARTANCEALIAQLDDVFSRRTYAEWSALFDAEPDFFWSGVNTMEDFINDPQTSAAGVFTEVDDRDRIYRQIAAPGDFHGTPAGRPRGAPLLGEHTEEVLAELAGRSSA